MTLPAMRGFLARFWFLKRAGRRTDNAIVSSYQFIPRQGQKVVCHMIPHLIFKTY